jgi:hypothetical protein
MIHMQESMLAEEQKRREAAEQGKKLAETEKTKHEVGYANTHSEVPTAFLSYVVSVPSAL